MIRMMFVVIAIAGLAHLAYTAAQLPWTVDMFTNGLAQETAWKCGLALAVLRFPYVFAMLFWFLDAVRWTFYRGLTVEHEIWMEDFSPNGH